MFSCGAYSDRGRKKENQDGLLLISSYIAPQRISEGSHIAILADGVSSCKNPKQASNLSIHTFLRKILEQYQSSNNM